MGTKTDNRQGDRHKPRHMVSIPPELWARLTERARDQERSVTWLVRALLAEHLERAGKTQ